MFDDRTHAGELLAEKLSEHNLKSPYILAVPRGGIAVAAPIAAKLNAKMAVLIAKKLGIRLIPRSPLGPLCLTAV